jgi:hypothetical protein
VDQETRRVLRSSRGVADRRLDRQLAALSKQGLDLLVVEPGSEGPQDALFGDELGPLPVGAGV